MSALPIVISAISLALSMIVAWFSFLNRGSLAMTHPVLVGFLFDLPQREPKIFFRALLYATGKRGHVIESLYLTVRRGEYAQSFSFWMYGETRELKIGSGLRVAEEGIALNHHFLPPKNDPSFQFVAGDYAIDIRARIVNDAKPKLLSTVRLSLSEDQASALQDTRKGVIFTWGPESRRYHGAVSLGPVHSYPPDDLSEGAAG